MGVTSALLRNVLADGEVIITPYSPQYIKNNAYELHNEGYISFFAKDDEGGTYGFAKAIDSEKPPKLEKHKIPKNGWCLEPNKLYFISTKEKIACPRFATTVTTHPDLARYGLMVTIENAPAYTSTAADIDITMSVAHPLIIYPEQRIVNLTIDPGDAGDSAIPIGGIIGWNGGPLPYGFCYCDGSHGSPNLMGHVLVGGSANTFLGLVLDGCHPAHTEHTIALIMRYK